VLGPDSIEVPRGIRLTAAVLGDEPVVDPDAAGRQCP
jgi:hypothetical protein